MSDDWQVGDLAWCVKGGPSRPAPWQRAWPERGKIYLVIAPRLWPDGDCFLLLKGAPDNMDECGYNWGPLWGSERFRRVTPGEAADEFDREFIALLTGKPATVPA